MVLASAAGQVLGREGCLTAERGELDPCLRTEDLCIGIVAGGIRAVLLGQPESEDIGKDRTPSEPQRTAFGVHVRIEEQAAERTPHGVRLLPEHEIAARRDAPVGISEVQADALARTFPAQRLVGAARVVTTRRQQQRAGDVLGDGRVEADARADAVAAAVGCVLGDTIDFAFRPDRFVPVAEVASGLDAAGPLGGLELVRLLRAHACLLTQLAGLGLEVVDFSRAAVGDGTQLLVLDLQFRVGPLEPVQALDQCLHLRLQRLHVGLGGRRGWRRVRSLGRHGGQGRHQENLFAHCNLLARGTDAGVVGPDLSELEWLPQLGFSAPGRALAGNDR